MAFPSQRESLCGPEGAGQSPATGAAWEDYLWRSQVLSQHHKPAGCKAGVGVGPNRLGGWLGVYREKAEAEPGTAELFLLFFPSFSSLLSYIIVIKDLGGGTATVDNAGPGLCLSGPFCQKHQQDWDT